MKAALRMALQYVLLFGATGVSLPFAGLWLSAHGLNGAQIGAVLSAPMLARIITGPLLAVWADGFRLRRTPIAILGVVMTMGYGLAGVADGFGLRAAGWFVGATAMGALVPLTDVLTLRLASRLGFTFALPRGVGSAAFVVANVAMGALLLTTRVDAVIVWIVVASLAFAVAAFVVRFGEVTLAGFHHHAPNICRVCRAAHHVRQSPLLRIYSAPDNCLGYRIGN
jgi:PPP family 3-phenylpropionic acid transporter